MEFFSDHETGTTATLLDVANHTSNAPKVNKFQAILRVQDSASSCVDRQAAEYIHGDTKSSNVVVVRKGFRSVKHADFNNCADLGFSKKK